jgi:hypothetical protein
MVVEARNGLLRLAIATFFLAVNIGAGLAADAGDFHDLRGRLTIKASPEWTIHKDKNGDADIDCHSSACKTMPADQWKRTCFLLVRYAKNNRAGPRLDRAAAAFLDNWRDGFASKIGPVIRKTPLTQKTLANGVWFGQSFDIDAVKTHDGVYSFEAWVGGHAFTRMVIYCVAKRAYWQTFPAYLERLASAVIWNAETDRTPAAKYKFAPSNDWDLRRNVAVTTLICKFKPCNRVGPSYGTHICMMAEGMLPGGKTPDRAALSAYASAAAAKVVAEEWHGSGYETSLSGPTIPTTLNGIEWYFTPVTGRYEAQNRYKGGIWTTANRTDGMVLTIKCIFEKDEWPVVEAKVKDWAASLVWSPKTAN